MTIAEALERATALHQQGNLPEAEKLYRQILSTVPNQPSALHYLGVLANQVGRADISVTLIEKSLRLQDDPVAWSNYGESLRALGRNKDALAAYDKATTMNPQLATAWSNKGLVLRTLKRLEESEASCRRAIELDPNFAGAYQNLCNVLGDRGQFEEAIVAGKRAAELSPQNPDAHADLGAAYVEAADLENAIPSFQRAINIDPNNADAHHNLAQAFLLSGNYPRGWDEYEWRWKSPSFPSPKRNFPQPQWNGEPIGAKTLFIHAEQGFGDSIMFSRYFPPVRALLPDVTIIAEIQPDLRAILPEIPGPNQWLSRGDAIPPFDFHCPLLSLPRAMKTTPETIPAMIPYLTADPTKAAQWRERLTSLGDWLKVGIVWAGRPTHANDHNRSTPLTTFARLANDRVTFVSLQKGPAAAQVAKAPSEFRVIDWTEDLRDFSDTAALIANLDLIIAVDTSVVHLAGAMGKPVWVIVPYAADWRWLRRQENTSPWYPTMRLFRLPRPGAWETVMSRVAQELGGLLEH